MNGEEASIPGTGSPESAAWFRDQLAALGATNYSLARVMVRYGDDREETTIERQLDRMAAGDVRVPSEMRVLLGMMANDKTKVARPEVPIAYRIGAMTRYFSRTERLREKFLQAGSWLIKNWGQDFENKIKKRIAEDTKIGRIRSDPLWLNTTAAWVDVQLFHEQWISSLFVVVEGYRKLIAVEKSFRDPALTAIIHHEFAKEMKEFRNVVYHFEIAYYYPEHRSRLRSPEAMVWLNKLQDAMHEFFDKRVSEFYKENKITDPMSIFYRKIEEK